MHILDYVERQDVEGNNEHYRKAIRSLLKLHPDVAEAFLTNKITLIDAMLLAWVPQDGQVTWLPHVIGGEENLVHYLAMEKPS